MSKQPVSFLLQVVITGGGTPVVKSYYENGRVVTRPLSVNVGDRVGWLVQAVLLNLNRTTPPFVVHFDNSTFFGVPSISAPHGGISEFLTVQEQQGSVKYSLSATGFGQVLDPVVQSGDGSVIILGKNKAVTVGYTVTWDIHHDTVTWSDGHGPQPFPLKSLNAGDTVTFVTVPPADAGTFVAKFQFKDSSNPPTYASPFSSSDATVKVTGSAVPVIDNYDSGNAFVFTATAMVAGVPKATKTGDLFEVDMG